MSTSSVINLSKLGVSLREQVRLSNLDAMINHSGAKAKGELRRLAITMKCNITRSYNRKLKELGNA